MSNRTVHENTSPESLVGDRVERIDTPTLLSTLWIAMLLANLFRDVHEFLRPGFVDELASDGTVHGTEVTDETLLVSGVGLVFLVSVPVLTRVLGRVWSRRVNVAAAVVLAAGVLATWPKDPDDLLFGAYLLGVAALVVAICVRWTDDRRRHPMSRTAP